MHRLFTLICNELDFMYTYKVLPGRELAVPNPKKYFSLLLNIYLFQIITIKYKRYMNFYKKCNDNAVICCVTLIQHGLRVNRIRIIKKVRLIQI